MKKILGSFALLISCGTAAAAAVDLQVVGLSVTQATQSEDQAVPLVAARRAFVRVFVVANGDNSVRPKVRLQFVYGRKVRFQRTFDPPRELRGVPREVRPNDHGASWNTLVPADWIQPGLKIVAEVDPDRRVRESNEGNNVWPSKSGQPFDVRTARPLKLTLVPIVLPDGRASELTAKNVETYISYARRVFPIPEKLDVQIHRPVSTSADVTVASGFSRTLTEVDALRIVEHVGDRFYAGLINPAVPGAFGGLAYLAGKASLSLEWTRPVDQGRLSYREYVLGHELGHNLSLPHAPCGNPGNPDLNFPYDLAGIGRPGFDAFLSRAYTPESGAVDLMSYCTTEPWISDYNYLKVLRFRERATNFLEASEVTSGEETEALLVWGHETATGWVLEPAFRVRGVPEPATGTAAVSLIDAAGKVTSRRTVRLNEFDHVSGRAFAALVPVSGDSPAALRLEIDGRVVAERRAVSESRLAAAPRAFRTDDDTVLVAWDDDARPLALLRDPDSGEVLGFARGGRVSLPSRAERIEVLLSNGVDSVKREFDVP